MMTWSICLSLLYLSVYIRSSDTALTASDLVVMPDELSRDTIDSGECSKRLGAGFKELEPATNADVKVVINMLYDMNDENTFWIKSKFDSSKDLNKAFSWTSETVDESLWFASNGYQYEPDDTDEACTVLRRNFWYLWPRYSDTGKLMLGNKNCDGYKAKYICREIKEEKTSSSISTSSIQISTSVQGIDTSTSVPSLETSSLLKEIETSTSTTEYVTSTSTHKIGTSSLMYESGTSSSLAKMESTSVIQASTSVYGFETSTSSAQKISSSTSSNINKISTSSTDIQVSLTEPSRSSSEYLASSVIATTKATVNKPPIRNRVLKERATVPVVVCPCQCPNNTKIHSNVSTKVTNRLTYQLKRNLTIATDDLSKNVRKKTSAEDNRSSSKFSGAIAIFALVLTFGVLVIFDLMNLGLICIAKKAKTS